MLADDRQVGYPLSVAVMDPYLSVLPHGDRQSPVESSGQNVGSVARIFRGSIDVWLFPHGADDDLGRNKVNGGFNVAAFTPVV